MKQIIKEGDKFGRLTAVRFDHKRRYTKYWLFRCECGVEKVIYASSVKNGITKSCGCLNNEVRKSGINGRIHGMTGTKIHNIWKTMKQRCFDKNCSNYKNYGGRRITICDRWLGKNGFINFFADMGECPESKSLDRINNNLGYSKKNCKYSTNEEQANNKRTNHLLTFNNKTQTIAQWARELNINCFALYSRIYKGWSVKRALTFNIKL